MEGTTRYQERMHEFGAAYEDSETSQLVKIIVATGEFLERLTAEPDAVDAAMKVLYERTSKYSAGEGVTWRECWENAEMDPGVVEMSDYFVGLNAYAYFGLALEGGHFSAETSSERERTWGEYLKKGRDLLESIPDGWAEVADLATTLLAAEARFRVDFGHDVSIEQLAALARVNPKSIRNLLTPKSGEPDLRVGAEGLIPGAVALRWLGKRGDFKNSIWLEADGEVETSPQSNRQALEEVVFVPVAKDGTSFDPLLCRNGRGYTIGPKGAEQPVVDYFDALQLLSKAATPHWRRPNDNGNWGIVAGVSWQRRDATELKKQLAKTSL